MNTAKLLRQLRKEKEITMDEMVIDLKRYGVSPSKSMISRWESGKAEPSMEYARILAQYYGVSLDYLLGLSAERSSVSATTSPPTTIAAHAVDDLTPEEQQEVMNFIQYVKSKRRPND
ncbi:helix-turn-helix transcriptional regulator [Fusibacter paucivorans]|uniref:Helix-turn-helix transcriptional regulator n=1 Tax=Fusibacter paucivorans TaxID=76009 RepID=A0ABS5PRZ2_9FIRM|nr:helix-turn-helix transcriptional regulator [Fusibacter paucivorans]MBS7527853.1 helix-turn-helix transcriptional regulator [Fusibacter paucivorans]